MSEKIEPGSAYEILARRYQELLNEKADLHLRLVRVVRESNFKISCLEQATGADSAKVIADLRMKLARRYQDVYTKVRYMQDTYPYTAPENTLALFMAFANQINDVVQQWEDEDAAAAGDVPEVPGSAA